MYDWTTRPTGAPLPEMRDRATALRNSGVAKAKAEADKALRAAAQRKAAAKAAETLIRAIFRPLPE